MDGRNRLDHDEIYCPISRSPMRHPIRLSSGYCCELELLLQMINISGSAICPVTRKKITSVIYDEKLKALLDENYNNDSERHDDYSKDELLEQLNNIIYPFKKAAYNGLYIGTIAGLCTYYSLSNLFHSESMTHSDQINYSLALTTLTTGIELTCQYMSRHQFGIFGGMQRIINHVKDSIANDRVDEYPDATLQTIINGL